MNKYTWILTPNMEGIDLEEMYKYFSVIYTLVDF